MTFTWGTVASVSPVRVILDGDTTSLPFAPESLIDPRVLVAADRVRCELSGNRLVIHGHAGGESQTWLPQNTFSPSEPAGSYPLGSSSMLVNPDVGWPNMLYGNVVTHRGYAAAGYATIQYYNSYQSADPGVYYREWFYLASAWSAWKRLAVAGDGLTPFAMATGIGSFAMTGTTQSLSITFPTGRFSQPPIVQMSTRSASFGVGFSTNPSATGMSVLAFNGASGVTIPYQWTAVQMLTGSGAG